MLELAPGVYAHPRLSARVRTRLWEVLADWYSQLRRGSIVMTWAESSANGGPRPCKFGRAGEGNRCS
ncbi:type I-E CRISPR-associated endoribonuclease Cas2e [Acidiphilium sp. PA]|nr:type I-E CRISPR-associated endoribonuclease Cas2e [Acidiphilium sp. PA]